IEISANDQKHPTPSLTFTTHSEDDLIAIDTKIDNQTLYAGIFPDKTTLYQGEQAPFTIKIYSPESLPVANWKLPESEKQNLLAWRFSIPERRTLGSANIKQQPFVTATYRTVMSGIDPGKAVFGPSTLGLIVVQSIMDPRFGSRRVNTQLEIPLPSTTFNILPLPPGAPAGFDGAVGQLQIDAHASKTSLTATEATEVILRVGGSGNLETLHPPKLSNSEWEVIDTSKVTRGEERKNLSGIVTFKQLIRPANPTQPPSEIPAYQFSYFDPQTKTYHTLTTSAIPVQVTPAPITPGNTGQRTNETLGAPIEEMRDILGFLDRPNKTIPLTKLSPYFHLIPAAVLLLLIAAPIRRKLSAMRATTPEHRAKTEDFQSLENVSDTRDFYLAAGHYIERWLPQRKETDAVLAERDEVCFLPDGKPLPELSATKKNEILALLKKFSKASFIIALMLTTQFSYGADDGNTETLTQAHSAWKAGQYADAIKLYQTAFPNPTTTPADVHYNVGNCYHRLEQPGPAALAWRRALRIDPTHAQARQNLRYLHKQTNAVVPEYSIWQYHLSRLPQYSYRWILYASIWLLAISLTLLVFYRKKHLTLGIVLCVITPITSSLSYLAIRWYPDDHLYCALSDQAVLLEDSALYSEAHHEDASDYRLPAASLLQVIAQRDHWTFVRSDDDEGWIPSDIVGKVAPD
ncbi:MAG: hypothetical protein ACPG32_13875, partial [Akkermansiaceae bacterium]